MGEYKDCKNCIHCKKSFSLGIEDYYCRLKNKEVLMTRITAFICRFFKR